MGLNLIEINKGEFIPDVEFDYFSEHFDVKIIDGKEYKHRHVTDHVFNSKKDFNKKTWTAHEMQEFYWLGITDYIPKMYDVDRFVSGSIYKRGITYSQNLTLQLLSILSNHFKSDVRFGITQDYNFFKIYGGEVSFHLYRIGSHKITASMPLTKFALLDFSRFENEWIVDFREAISEKKYTHEGMIADAILKGDEVEMNRVLMMIFDKQIKKQEQIDIYINNAKNKHYEASKL